MNRGENWIDFHDDELMVALGIRVPKLPENMLNTCPKSEEERKMLRKCKHRSGKKDMHFHTVPPKRGVWGKLTIKLKSNNVFDKSVHVTHCYDYDIPYIISQYAIPKKKGKEEYMESVVHQVSWNGQKVQINYNN